MLRRDATRPSSTVGTGSVFGERSGHGGWSSDCGHRLRQGRPRTVPLPQGRRQIQRYAIRGPPRVTARRRHTQAAAGPPPEERYTARRRAAALPGYSANGVTLTDPASVPGSAPTSRRPSRPRPRATRQPPRRTHVRAAGQPDTSHPPRRLPCGRTTEAGKRSSCASEVTNTRSVVVGAELDRTHDLVAVLEPHHSQEPCSAGSQARPA